MLTQETANMYLKLGIPGAALFLILVFIVLQFRNNNKITKAFENINNNENLTQNNKIEKLCEKIDDLVTSNNKHIQVLNTVLISTDKNHSETLNLLQNMNTLTIENHRRISRIDDRTYSCLKEN